MGSAEEVWYRYDHVQIGPDDASVWLGEYPVAKVTRCGVRLTTGRFVNRNTKKRWACPTKEEAMFSFKKRKAKQIEHLTLQLTSAKAALRRAESGELMPACEFGDLTLVFG